MPTLDEKIQLASTCQFNNSGSCKLNGYPPFDCHRCSSYKIKEESKIIGFVLHEIEVGAYYAGDNEKYGDMFNMNTKHGAKVFSSEEDAQRVADHYNKRGYRFVVKLK